MKKKPSNDSYGNLIQKYYMSYHKKRGFTNDTLIYYISKNDKYDR